jgi:hypothetical protein
VRLVASAAHQEQDQSAHGQRASEEEEPAEHAASLFIAARFRRGGFGTGHGRRGRIGRVDPRFRRRRIV